MKTLFCNKILFLNTFYKSDVRKENLTIDFEDLKKKYSKDCVAVICVHMGGHPSQM